MAFVVETGEGLEDANSNCSVEFADAYFADRGVTAWDGDTELKKQALIKATDFIETRWGQVFRGRPAVDGQALSFPRLGLYNARASLVLGMPDQVKKATCEYALRARTAVLAPDPTVDPSGLQVQSRSSELGPLKESVTFAAGSGAQINTPVPYPAADRLLAGLVRQAGVYR